VLRSGLWERLGDDLSLVPSESTASVAEIDSFEQQCLTACALKSDCDGVEVITADQVLEAEECPAGTRCCSLMAAPRVGPDCKFPYFQLDAPAEDGDTTLLKMREPSAERRQLVEHLEDGRFALRQWQEWALGAVFALGGLAGFALSRAHARSSGRRR